MVTRARRCGDHTVRASATRTTPTTATADTTSRPTGRLNYFRQRSTSRRRRRSSPRPRSAPSTRPRPARPDGHLRHCRGRAGHFSPGRSTRAGDHAGGPVAADHRFLTRVSMHGKPGQCDPAHQINDGWFDADTPGAGFIAGEPHSCTVWYPCNDHPTDKATFELTATVPTAVLGDLQRRQADDHRDARPRGRLPRPHLPLEARRGHRDLSDDDLHRQADFRPLDAP